MADRYGSATTDPLGRDGPGWELDDRSRLPVWKGEGRELRAGQLCAVCACPIWPALWNAGVRIHPTC